MKSDEKKCTRCAEFIKKDALVCKHCGNEFSASTIVAEKAAAAKAGQKNAIGCAAVVGLLLLVGMCSSSKEATKSTSADTSLEPAFNPAEAKAREIANKDKIAAKLAEAKALPETDITGNARLYGELVSLAPLNTGFVEKRDRYQAILADAEAKSAVYADHPEKALEIVKFTWEKGGFDNIQLVHFTVKNNAPFALKDFELTCNHQGPSGTDMDRNVRVVYELVPANGSKFIREVNMGFINAQAASSRCEITEAVRA